MDLEQLLIADEASGAFARGCNRHILSREWLFGAARARHTRESCTPSDDRHDPHCVAWTRAIGRRFLPVAHRPSKCRCATCRADCLCNPRAVYRRAVGSKPGCTAARNRHCNGTGGARRMAGIERPRITTLSVHAAPKHPERVPPRGVAKQTQAANAVRDL